MTNTHDSMTVPKPTNRAPLPDPVAVALAGNSTDANTLDNLARTTQDLVVAYELTLNPHTSVETLLFLTSLHPEHFGHSSSARFVGAIKKDATTALINRPTYARMLVEEGVSKKLGTQTELECLPIEWLIDLVG